jgi:hypothetical protein
MLKRLCRRSRSATVRFMARQVGLQTFLLRDPLGLPQPVFAAQLLHTQPAALPAVSDDLYPQCNGHATDLEPHGSIASRQAGTQPCYLQPSHAGCNELRLSYFSRSHSPSCLLFCFFISVFYCSLLFVSSVLSSLPSDLL